MEGIFSELTFILIVAFILGFILRLLKLPELLGYILAGLIIGPLALIGKDAVKEEQSLTALSQIGITLLLFILGLELKLGELRSVGKVSLITGIGQIVFTSLIGFGLCLLLGFESRESIYMAIALTFSSTIVIVKLLSDKKDINTLYGRISIGFLLIQDFFAILALIILNGLNQDSTDNQWITLIILFAKTIFLFIAIIVLSQSIIPTLIKQFSQHQEMLFLFSIAWAFGISALVSSEFIGLSIEIGGFLAGLALANSVESLQIASKVKALRDFFIVIFFVHLGIGLEITNIEDALVPGLILSIFVLIGNPIIVMVILGLLGYKSRTSFMSGLSVAQVSEFSLIVMFLGNSLGHVSDNVVSIVTIVAIITFAASSYMILNAEKLYLLLQGNLKIFEKKRTIENNLSSISEEFENHIVLVGAHRMGNSFLKYMQDNKHRLIVVDYDPQTARELALRGFQVVFGDIADKDIQNKAQLIKARIVVSTIPNLEDNIILISSVKAANPKIKIIVHADRPEFAEELKKAGADIVLQPLLFAGKLLSSLVLHEELDFEE